MEAEAIKTIAMDKAADLDRFLATYISHGRDVQYGHVLVKKIDKSRYVCVSPLEPFQYRPYLPQITSRILALLSQVCIREARYIFTISNAMTHHHHPTIKHFSCSTRPSPYFIGTEKMYWLHIFAAFTNRL